VSSPGGFNARIWAVAGALVVGFVLGRWAGVSFAGVEGESGPEAAGSESVAPAQRSGPAVVTDAPLLVDRIAELQRELALHKVAKETYEVELYGEPVEWPEMGELPAAYQPDRFRIMLAEALRECEADLVDVECSEPPCLALLRSHDRDHDGPLLDRCAGWADQFGGATSGKHMHIECADGSRERVHFVAPSARELLPDDHHDEDWANLRKRLTQRYEQIELGWECAVDR
jgi:hypothetical protein